MRQVDVLVIGGGISGLSTAWLMADAGLNVEVWEQQDRIGGKIHSEHHAGYLLEQAASMVLNFRPEVTHFMQRTNLEQHRILRTSTAKRYIADNDCLYEIPLKLGPMLRSPLWSSEGRLRMFMEPFIPRGRNRSESVSEFIQRRLGSEILDKAIGPYVSGPLAADPEKACARSTLPRLTALEQHYGSLTAGIFVHRILRRRTATATEAFSFEGGMSTLTGSLAHDLSARIKTGHTARELIPVSDGWHITGGPTGANSEVHVKNLVLSIPATAAAALLSPLDRKLGKLLDEIEYAPVSVVHTGFSNTAMTGGLDGSGFLATQRCAGAVTGSQWMSSLFTDHAPNGKVLLSNYLGGARHPETADWDDERCMTEVMSTLFKLTGISSDPEMVRVHRHPQALPLYHGDYYQRLQAISEHLGGLPGLDLVANYRGGVSVRDRIVAASQSANSILSQFQKLPQTHKICAPAASLAQTP